VDPYVVVLTAHTLTQRVLRPPSIPEVSTDT